MDKINWEFLTKQMENIAYITKVIANLKNDDPEKIRLSHSLKKEMNNIAGFLDKNID